MSAGHSHRWIYERCACVISSHAITRRSNKYASKRRQWPSLGSIFPQFKPNEESKQNSGSKNWILLELNPITNSYSSLYIWIIGAIGATALVYAILGVGEPLSCGSSSAYCTMRACQCQLGSLSRIRRDSKIWVSSARSPPTRRKFCLYTYRMSPLPCNIKNQKNSNVFFIFITWASCEENPISAVGTIYYTGSGIT